MVGMFFWQYHRYSVLFRSFFLLFLIKACLLQATNQDSSCDCPNVFRPVCGTDNVTYNNLCVLRCAQIKNRDISFFYNGTCCPQNECNLESNQLCDTFGKTHLNECHFKRFQCIMEKTMGLMLEKLYDGTCIVRNCTTVCSDDYDPVCDTNSTVYRNLCVFEKRKCELEVFREKIELAENKKFCLPGLKPNRIAGVDSYTSYIEDDYIEPTNGLNLSSVAETETTTTADEIITTQSATNFVDQKTIFRDIPSSTGLNQACSIGECDRQWNPVCDTRNRTHRNICNFKYHACKLYKFDGSLVDIAHVGPCLSKKSVCISCPKDEKPIPICDNKNMTHPNLCSFIQFNCYARQRNEEERVLVHIKQCHTRSPQFDLSNELCPKTCSRDSKPVCDEANNTYQNLCHFQQYNCNMRKLGIQSPYLRYLRPCIKHKNIDNAVENTEVELNANVTNIEIISTTPKLIENQKISEKTTFIVSAIDVQTKSPMSFVTIPSAPKFAWSTKQSTLIPALINDKSSTTTLSTQAQTTTTTSISNDVAFFDCPKPNCPTEGEPVCDSKGNLHGNLCEFTYSRCLAARKGEQLQISTEEKCVSKEACEMSCSDEMHPICASDFFTYENLCQFRKQKCREADLEILFKGKCNECLDSPCANPASDAPDDSFVCVEDGSTKSLCEYQMLSCIFERGYGVNLTIQYIGQCCPLVETCINEKADPICASNGVTYFTECEMNIENCKLAKLELPLLVVLSKGACKREDSTFIDDFPRPDERKFDVEFKRENTFNCSMECDNSYDPLCGTNGITYTNACSLQKEICDDKNNNSTIEIAYNGMCCDTSCPNDFSPVCDSKGNSHQNICHFGIRRCIAERTSGNLLTIDKFGLCDTVKECDFECAKEYAPLCTTNGQTLINECELRKINCLVSRNVTIGEIFHKDYDGECCKEEECDFSSFSPICDKDGITHANDCIFKKHSCIQMKKFNKTLNFAYKGQCCNQPCEEENNPVCDGETTYQNTCKFKIAQCEADRNNKTLSIAYTGNCCTIPQGDCSTSGPVCDSEGQTHSNHCSYQQKKCISQKTSSKNLNIVHTGECCALASCPKIDQPVCDSMGRTHDSLCHFHNSKCIFDKIHNQNNTLNLDYQGKCCQAGCTEKLEVTCDQHGNIYRNECYFKLKACETLRRTQDVLLSSPCPLLKS